MPATPTATQAPTSSEVTKGSKFLVKKLSNLLIIKVSQGSESLPGTDKRSIAFITANIFKFFTLFLSLQTHVFRSVFVFLTSAIVSLTQF